MNIKSFTFNPFQENTYVVYDESKECIIIDPGCYNAQEQEELKRFINEKELTPVKLINTHCHIDHILGNQFVAEKWNLDLYMHKLDIPLLDNAGEIGKMYGFEEYKGSPYPKHFLDEKDTLTFGKSKFNILFTPGHAPGHICLYNKENDLLVAGDVIFQGSIGRTDLPGGNHETLINSIITKLFPLPNSTQIFCGHGPSTNLGYEKEHNPFLQ
jgi:glyoxylase-like metal-dependent hydrolase (beta-lactamase superfamily II)